MSAQGFAHQRISPGESPAGEHLSETRHESMAGAINAMADASVTDNTINFNVKNSPLTARVHAPGWSITLRDAYERTGVIS